MNVQASSPRQAAARKTTTRGTAFSGEAKTRGFGRSLSDAQDDLSAQRIEQLRGKIERQGARLAEKMDLAHLQEYRELISMLLTELTRQAYQYHQSDQFDASGHYQSMGLIQKVNQTLDDMAQALVQEEKETLVLLEMVDDIRGLLIDLLA